MIEIVGLCARYNFTHSPAVTGTSTPVEWVRYAPLSMVVPDGGVPLLDAHDDERRIGWVLGAFVHDRAGLAVLAEVPHPHLLRHLGLSVGYEWDFRHSEAVEDRRGRRGVVLTRALLTEISVVRDPACPGCAIGAWRPAVRYGRVVRSWVEGSEMREAA